jgi:hypothetical protein
MDAKAVTSHCNSKPHKRRLSQSRVFMSCKFLFLDGRLRSLMEPAYTQREAECAAGKGSYYSCRQRKKKTNDPHTQTQSQ